jgi:hypothetical protein
LQSLEQEKHPYLERRAIGEARVKVCTDAADRTNDLFRRAAVAIHKCWAPIVSSGSEATLGELMREVVAEASTGHADDVAGLTRSYLHALALLVITDGIDIDLFATSPRAKPEEQE